MDSNSGRVLTVHWQDYKTDEVQPKPALVSARISLNQPTYGRRSSRNHFFGFDGGNVSNILLVQIDGKIPNLGYEPRRLQLFNETEALFHA